MILMNDLQAQYLSLKKEIDEKINKTLMSGWYINGEEVKGFERDFSSYTGVAHSVGVANGTEAIQLALLAAGIKSGDEVITVSHTAVATVAAVHLAGATPVLVDINPSTYVMDAKHLEKALSPKTRAVVLVHLYGHAGPINEVRDFCKRNKLVFIEDCAQAHGALYEGKKVGSFGDLSCFSFYPTKNLGAIGDGGMVSCQDSALFERICQLREYGWKSRYISEIEGMNSRLDELQAGILRVKLTHLDKMNDNRRKIAQTYRECLGASGLTLPVELPQYRHVYHLFVIRHSSKRDEIIQQLKASEIMTAIHYPSPIHLQPAYKGKIKTVGQLVETEKAAQTICSLPIYPELGAEQVQKICKALLAIKGL